MTQLQWLHMLVQQSEGGTGHSPPPGSGGDTIAPAGAGGATQGQAPPPGGDPMSMIWMMVLIFGLMYFLLIWPQSRQRKQLEKRLDSMKKGDQVLFAGIYGEIVEVPSKENQNTAEIRIAENVKVKVARGAISAVIDRNT